MICLFCLAPFFVVCIGQPVTICFNDVPIPRVRVLDELTDAVDFTVCLDPTERENNRRRTYVYPTPPCVWSFFDNSSNYANFDTPCRYRLEGLLCVRVKNGCVSRPQMIVH